MTHSSLVKTLSHATDHAVVFLFLFLAPVAASGDQITIRADLSSEAGEEHLFGCIPQIGPKCYALASRKTIPRVRLLRRRSNERR
jgi:hypothetical protein